jgi:hypothetical protein
MDHITPKTLVLGMAVGMTLEEVKPFFLSLEKTGYRGDICMCVAGLDRATVEFLRARRVNLVPFQKAYLGRRWAYFAALIRLFMRPGQRRQFDRQVLLTYLHLHCARHVFCRDYLAECGGGYDQVMMADTRDVIFQRDPFAFEMPDGLSTFMEDASQTIGSCIYNSSWIRAGFGAAVLQELADKRIFCSGVIYGSPAVLLDYFEQVLQLYSACKPRSSIDQATHNYILYKQPPKPWQAFENGAGPVLTLGYMKPHQFRFNEQGLLVNADGRAFNTLHQYDRHPELAQRLIRLLT